MKRAGSPVEGGTEPPPWHVEALPRIFARLEGNKEGLSDHAADRRLARHGPNELPRPASPGVLLIFCRQFKNPLVYLLVAAAAVSLLVGELFDALFIFIVLLFNAAIGALQEWQAGRKADELDKLVPHRVMVRRDGRWKEIPTAGLVPGDIVRLETGCQVSADLRLVESQDLQVDESLLTGESVAVLKCRRDDLPAKTPLAERSNMLFAGTTLLAGRAEALVVLTGRETQVGQIAQSLAAGRGQPPPLVRQLDRLSRLIGLATILLIGLVAWAEILQGMPLVSVFMVAVALAVAAIPEGLPIAITVALAIATNRMHRRNVIVRSLPAVEGLGSCTLIASDKTGTLTCNELTIEKAVIFDPTGLPLSLEVAGEGAEASAAVTVAGRPAEGIARARMEDLARSAAICNEALIEETEEGTKKLGDTVDLAFLVLAAKMGLDWPGLRQGTAAAQKIPYEPERRFGAVLMADGDRREAHVKGAAEVLLGMCRGIDRQRVETEVENLARDGYRVLAVARGEIAAAGCHADDRAALKDLTFLGLVGLIDPIRPEVPAAIARCRDAGISVRMVTGDHPATALSVARQLGIADNRCAVASGDDIARLAAMPDALSRFVAQKTVFARVEPAQKLTIVEAYQRCGEVVAVTGDGVNDGPALDAADIGVAMGRSGTDVARGAADLVLADDNFVSIVAGVEEGRVAYDNVRKLVYLLISTGLGEIVLFVMAILLGLPAPFLAVQLLWLNLVTNGIQDVALAFEKGEPGVLARRPRPPGERLFEKRMIAQVTVAGLYMGIATCVAYKWFLDRGLPVEEARNLILLLMVLFENAHAFNARSERLSVFRLPLSANWFLMAAIIGAQALHLGALFMPGLAGVLRVQPISLFDWLFIALIALSLLAVMEVFKRFWDPGDKMA